MRSPRAIRLLVAALGVLLAASTAVAAAAPALQASLARPAAVALHDVAVSPLTRSSAQRRIDLPIRADMIGASWRGRQGALELRSRSADGSWSDWVELDAGGGEGPDPGSSEARRQRGRTVLAVPLWVGGADELQVRLDPHGRGASVRGLQLAVINVTGTGTARERRQARMRATAAQLLDGVAPEATAMPVAPPLSLRSAWGARAARVTPAYADAARGVVVHHTATTNSYSCTLVPAILRGIQRYHMDSNGWNDIGYNFLVDRCGRVWEGRGGGMLRPVIGAHTAGFNTDTVGIALLGSHGAVRPTAAARSALQRLVSWRMDHAHVAPTGRMALTARSSDRYALGSRVVARAVSGHRDLYPTSCPGAITYRELNALARAAWRSGGLKVANITTAPVFDQATGMLQTLRVRAVTGPPPASGAVATAIISVQRISDGTVLASTRTTGPVHLLSWSASGATVPVWDVRVVIGAERAGQRARPYRGLLGAWGDDPGFSVTTAPPSSVAPGGDPSDDVLRLDYVLARDAQLGAWLHDPASGALVATLRKSGAAAASTDPVALELVVPRSVAAGEYELRVGDPGDLAPGRSIERFPLSVRAG